jgi:ligand-binding SRPBCC domain-containing protein
MTVARPRDDVFEFFSNAANLELLTPDTLGFSITSKMPIEMKQGALIDYRLSLYGLPINWQTEITAWDPPNYFIDTQLSGPYKQWIHRHDFIETPDGTIIEDSVRYRLPLEPLGDLAHFFVRMELEKIFDYRTAAVEKAFSLAPV